ncbi:erythromycin esterase family protein [Amycolatopsis balhimycina DSM 5908]|uniref:Erythromycin esterase family protein n=1 Tax=Amycolatopsis balhimycina DSM 5908 TaxID=1081091 RepID=A0A428WYT0_AMYBA|nr:erythromycin esterase family protein [Amycolatopsis balhimycina]RSM48226.1 erythromycin esterase family protein [Amycolatopsis balhimycina DSM 5908]
MDIDLTEWLRENIVRLRTIEPDDAGHHELEPLRDIVGDARVVAIGESTHRVHEFYQLRHLVTRFLVEEMGFTGFAMESGFPEGWAVHDWVLGGDGDLDRLLHTGITYHMGKCAEMRDQLVWMREHNRSHDRKVRFYGMDLPDSSASALPGVVSALSFLDEADPAYAAAARRNLLPLFEYLPADRTGLAWAAPAIHGYLALGTAHRHELTARIGELTERLRALRVPYSTVDSAGADIALQCAVTARHADAFLANMAAAPERTYRGANVRDAAMADNVEWILDREERLVVGAANGHLQRWPYRVPPIINEEQVMLGQHLARSLGNRMVVIATTYNGGRVFGHRPLPDGPPGHTEVFYEDVAPFTEPGSLDALLASAGEPLALLDLRDVPEAGAVARRFAEIDGTRQGPYKQLANPLVAFDAVVHIDRITPWRTVIDVPDARV